jgi:predicted O-methyltransferase YrrM
MARSREISQRITRHLWRALTPSSEGPARGRTLEAVRRMMETRMDAARLRERLPELAQHGDARERVWAQLLPLYRRFVAHVSPPSRCMSLEVAGFLAHACERFRPQRVLEVGTGFASPVLRRLGEAPEWLPEVWSVDHDPARLVRIQAFLETESLPIGRLLSWRQFCATSESDFELVLHDLVGAPGDALTDVVDRVKPGGLLLLDGAHDPAAERRARRLLTEAGAEHWSLRSLTRDCYGRFAILALR